MEVSIHLFQEPRVCFEVHQSCTTTPDAPLLFMIRFRCFRLSVSGDVYLVCNFTQLLSTCSRYTSNQSQKIRPSRPVGKKENFELRMRETKFLKLTFLRIIADFTAAQLLCNH